MTLKLLLVAPLKYFLVLLKICFLQIQTLNKNLNEITNNKKLNLKFNLSYLSMKIYLLVLF